MKKLFLLLIIVGVFLTSCGGGGDSSISLQNVEKTFPNGLIYRKSSFTYIVHDTVTKKMYYVTTMNSFDDEVNGVKVLEQVTTKYKDGAH